MKTIGVAYTVRIPNDTDAVVQFKIISIMNLIYEEMYSNLSEMYLSEIADTLDMNTKFTSGELVE